MALFPSVCRRTHQHLSTLELLPMERQCHRRRCGANRCFANFGFRSSVSRTRKCLGFITCETHIQLKIGIWFPAKSCRKTQKKQAIYAIQFRIVVPYRISLYKKLERPSNSALQRASMPMAPMQFLESLGHLDNDLLDSFNAMELRSWLLGDYRSILRSSIK